MKNVFAACALVGLSGCASIFNGASQPVTIQSVPEGATISVTNRAGEKIHSGVAPATLTLKRGYGYFKSETYTVFLTKEGFAPKEMTISSSVSGWYIANLLFGGVIGMLAVDPSTGAMYVFPDSISGTLDAPSATLSQADKTLTIVSTDTLSAEQMEQARLVGATQ